MSLCFRRECRSAPFPIFHGSTLAVSLCQRIDFIMKAQSPVSLEIEDGVAVVTLDRPPVNALRPEGVQDIDSNMPRPAKGCCRRMSLLLLLLAAPPPLIRAVPFILSTKPASPLLWHAAVWEALFPLLRKAHANPSVKAIMLTGANGEQSVPKRCSCRFARAF